MALAVVAKSVGVDGSGIKRQLYTLVPPTEYPDEGITVDFSGEIGTVKHVNVTGGGTTTATGQYHGQYDYAAEKIVLRDLANAGAEPTTSTDLSGITFNLEVIGLE